MGVGQRAARCHRRLDTLAGLARDTSTIRLGTLVTPVTFRHPGCFAVTAAQVDQMSGGRVDIGLGAGWFDAEHEAFGLPFPDAGRRYDLLEDQLAILHGAWSAPSGVDVRPRRARAVAVHITADTVRPAQRPHPPIVLGGQGGPRSARLAATYADEYNCAFVTGRADAGHPRQGARSLRGGGSRPGSSSSTPPRQVLCCGETEAEVERRAAVIGREVGELRENGLAGSPAEVLDKLGRYAEAGAERFYLQVLDLTDLDHLRLVAEQVMPHAPGR